MDVVGIVHGWQRWQSGLTGVSRRSGWRGPLFCLVWRPCRRRRYRRRHRYHRCRRRRRYSVVRVYVCVYVCASVRVRVYAVCVSECILRVCRVDCCVLCVHTRANHSALVCAVLDASTVCSNTIRILYLHILHIIHVIYTYYTCHFHFRVRVRSSRLFFLFRLLL